MKRDKIIILITGIAILFGVIGSGIIIAQGIAAGKFQDSPSHTREHNPHAWELNKTKLDEFSNISISLSYCDFSILPGDDYYLEYRMDGACEKPNYEVSNDRFSFSEGQTQRQYRFGFHFFWNFGTVSNNDGPYYVNLYVPEEQYFHLLQISSESGDINLESIRAEEMEIHAEYGNLKAEALSGESIVIDTDSGNMDLGKSVCNTMELTNEYGDISAESLEISDKASIKLDSGNLNLASLNCSHLTLSNEYGNCSIDKINTKQNNIIIESGNLKLRDAILGDTEIENDYGDITIDLAGDASDYNYNMNAAYGSIKLDGKTLKSDEDGKVYYEKDNGKKDEIFIMSESGNIVIY